ncbi:barstar family protein [Micromonospora sp. NPDC048830]|uniref:barstar family protein n=1 Tax=Micromonospora sp. NPDC048830 TaxID=3364257 RepID=UPI003716DF2D
MTEGYAPGDLPPWLTVTPGPLDVGEHPAPPARLPAGAARTRAGLHAALVDALDLPGYTGRTWDALADVLRGRLDAGPLTLVVDDAGELLADEPDDQLALLLRVLGDAAADAGYPLRMVLRDVPDRLPALRARMRGGAP